MPKYLFSTIMCFVLASSIMAQSGNMQLAYIHKTAKEIRNNISNLRKIEVKSDSTGSQNVYSNAKELVMVTVDIKDNGVNKHVVWYFSDGKEIYAEQQWADYAGKLIDNECFYFNDWRLINWVKTDGSIVDSTSQEYKEQERLCVKYGKGLEVLYAKKSKNASK